KVKDIRPAIHAARLERAFLFAEVEQRDVAERKIIQVEIAAEIEAGFDEPGKAPAEEAAVSEGRGQPAQGAQRGEGRTLGIIDKVTPIAMIDGPAAGKDRGHTSGAVAKDRFEPAAMRSERAREWVLLDDFPSASVDENEQWQYSFHPGLTALPDGCDGAGEPLARLGTSSKR